MNQIVEKAMSRNAEESLKKFLYPDPQADHLQNLIHFSLFKHTPLIEFHRLSHENPICSFYVRFLTDGSTNKQTNKQTNAG